MWIHYFSPWPQRKIQILQFSANICFAHLLFFLAARAVPARGLFLISVLNFSQIGKVSDSHLPELQIQVR